MISVKTSDLLIMCLGNLFRRKFRTFLTVSGVVIGTTAIIVMISLGIAVSENQKSMMESFGDLTIIEVYGWNPDTPLNDEAIANIEALPGVKAVSPFSSYYDGEEINFWPEKNTRYKMRGYNMVGVNLSALDSMGFVLLEGKYPDENTVKSKDKIQVIVGEHASYSFEDTRKNWRNNRVFPYEDEYGVIPDPFLDIMKTPLYLEIIIDSSKDLKLKYEIEVIGRLQADTRKAYESFSGIFFDVKDLAKIKADYKKKAGVKNTNPYENPDSYNMVRVKVKNIDDAKGVNSAIKDKDQGFGFDTYSMENELEEMQKQSQQMQMILGGLGAVSLFVSAISITNTMIMSVYERTKEIGILKVLGCLVGNIRTIFLMEAGFIGLMGGIIGVILSYTISFVMNKFTELLSNSFLGNLIGGGYYYYGGDEMAKLSIIPPWLVVLGLVFATAIGLISGFYPANRAVKISALEAIRTE